jgi:hypothetical protein
MLAGWGVDDGAISFVFAEGTSTIVCCPESRAATASTIRIEKKKRIRSEIVSQLRSVVSNAQVAQVVDLAFRELRPYGGLTDQQGRR